jgi:FAD/FMN-containing dehydrogenase
MDRRGLIRRVAALMAAPLAGAGAVRARAAAPFRRCLPGDPEWPADARWASLGRAVGGRLERLDSPLDACRGVPSSDACATLFRELKNPYAIGDNPALTQTSGWIDGWTSSPSTYVVKAASAVDVAHAVNFAREHRLRLVVKGGGHSYQGTSNAPSSLCVWTRAMDAIEMHDRFVGRGCEGHEAAVPAVSVGAGCIWMRTYGAVVAGAGRYVQGGGCATVGVAGLIQSGGFGSFSKRFGTAASSLVEAEVVTANGEIRTVNACREPDLYWALKGGGGGSFGVVTRLTLRTHDLPATLGGAFLAVKASSSTAYAGLVARFVALYRDRLFDPHWGEQAAFRPDDTLEIAMTFQGLDEAGARERWRPFLEFVAASPHDYAHAAPPRFIALDARRFWDAAWLKQNLPSVVVADDRPGANPSNLFWAGNLGEAGQFLHGYESAWLPASLLRERDGARLADALVAASRHWRVGLHFNKGLAGAPPEAIAAARRTATNPAVVDAFALAIIGAEGPPAFPGLAGHEPDVAVARAEARKVADAFHALRRAVPTTGSYVSEAGFFDDDWRRAYWGANYPRLAAVKRRYDPDGLFTVHHGVGSEGWSADGNTRR